MKSLLISFSLDDPNSDYERISSQIKRESKWARITKNTWIVITENSISDLRSSLRSSIEDRGKILIIDVTGASWGTYAVSRRVTDWMKQNL